MFNFQKHEQITSSDLKILLKIDFHASTKSRQQKLCQKHEEKFWNYSVNTWN